jgi:serine protease Do
MLEGIVLATDGTMADYCDILRTHGSEATLAVEVVRYETGEYLAGQINGRPLETSFSFGSQLGDEVGGPGSGSASSYAGYMTVTDDDGAIQVEVPDSWTDVDGWPWVDEGEVIGASVYAARDLDAFLNTWDEPGVIFNVSNDLARLGGYVQLLDIVSADYRAACELDGRYDYEDPLDRGRYDFFVNCGGPGGAWYLILSAIDNPQHALILVEVQIISDADLAALDRILDTFQIIGVLP